MVRSIAEHRADFDDHHDCVHSCGGPLDPQTNLPPSDSKGRILSHVRLQGFFDGRGNLQVAYDPQANLEDMESKILSYLQMSEGTKVVLQTEPITMTPETWDIYNQPNASWVAEVVGAKDPMSLDPQPEDMQRLPAVCNVSDLLRQETGSRVALVQDGRRARTAIITRKEAKMAFRSLTARVPFPFKFTDEQWRYASGSELSSARLHKAKTIFLDIGIISRCTPSDAILSCYLVQESVVGTAASLTSAPDGQYTPVYRVRQFSDTSEAMEYALVDAIDYGFGVVGSYVALKEGTKVDGIWCEDCMGTTYGM